MVCLSAFEQLSQTVTGGEKSGMVSSIRHDHSIVLGCVVCSVFASMVVAVRAFVQAAKCHPQLLMVVGGVVVAGFLM